MNYEFLYLSRLDYAEREERAKTHSFRLNWTLPFSQNLICELDPFEYAEPKALYFNVTERTAGYD